MSITNILLTNEYFEVPYRGQDQRFQQQKRSCGINLAHSGDRYSQDAWLPLTLLDN